MYFLAPLTFDQVTFTELLVTFLALALRMLNVEPLGSLSFLSAFTYATAASAFGLFLRLEAGLTAGVTGFVVGVGAPELQAVLQERLSASELQELLSAAAELALLPEYQAAELALLPRRLWKAALRLL